MINLRRPADLKMASSLILSHVDQGKAEINFGVYMLSAQLPVDYTQVQVNGKPVPKGVLGLPDTTKSIYYNFQAPGASVSILNDVFTKTYGLELGILFIMTSDFKSNSINYVLANGDFGGLTQPLDTPESAVVKGGTVFIAAAEKDSITTYVHETGHALGLNDVTNYNGYDPHTKLTGTYEDNVAYTIMSYIGVEGKPLQGTLATSPQILDVAALQQLFGSRSNKADDTTYDIAFFAKDQLGQSTASMDALQTIWDSGGIDTFDASGGSGGAYIDLRPGHFSTIGPKENAIVAKGRLVDAGNQNVSIAFGTYVENATGSQGGANLLVGNSLSNHLIAGDHGDLLYADESQLQGDLAGKGDYRAPIVGGLNTYQPDTSKQQDVLDGGDGADYLYGGLGSTIMNGGIGADRFYPGLGTSQIDGGTESGSTNDGVDLINFRDQNFGDTLDLSRLPGAASVTLKDRIYSFSDKTGSNEGATGTFVNVERVVGTDFGDLFQVDGDMTIIGGKGNDTLIISTSTSPTALHGIVDLGGGSNIIDFSGGNGNADVICVILGNGDDRIQVTGATSNQLNGGIRVVSSGETNTTFFITPDYSGGIVNNGVTSLQILGSGSLGGLTYTIDNVQVTFNGERSFDPNNPGFPTGGGIFGGGPVMPNPDQHRHTWQEVDYEGILTIHYGSESIQVGEVVASDITPKDEPDSGHTYQANSWTLQSSNLWNFKFVMGGEVTLIGDNQNLQDFIRTNGPH